MQAQEDHESSHEAGGDHEAEVQKKDTEKEETLEHDGNEPAAKVASAAAPAGGASEHSVKATDTRGRDLGNFLLTHYTFALENDPVHASSPKVSAPGLPADKKYKKSFLGSPYGIKMQGTGLADDGHYIRYVGNGHYAYGVGGAAGAPSAWKTVAVDPSVIKLGSHLEIEAYKAKGTFEAKDTGGAIKGKHIDVFAGAVPIHTAYALGTKHSDVVLLDGSGGAHDEHAAKPEHHDAAPAGHAAAPAKHAAAPAAHHAAAAPHASHHKGYHPAPSLDAARHGKGVIKLHSEGASVRFVQEKVHAGVDGLFGPHTEAAVKKYQHSHHLAADGEVGKHTMAAMDGHGAKPAHGAPAHEVAGGGDHGGGDHAAAGSEEQVRNEVIAKAKSHSGAPYSWAAQGPSMFDCSGFSWYVLHHDTHLTDKGRTTAEGLSHAPYTTPTHSPQKGDLVFYGGSHKSHVTIALGSGSQTIGASGGGQNTHGNNPKAKVKQTDWSHDSRAKSFGSIDKLIQQKLHKKK